MKILIVEDEPVVADSLKLLIELGRRHAVVGIAAEFESALALAEQHNPDLALVDIQLAENSSGYEVADALTKLGIPSIFSTATPPPFEVPELALGCLVKPFGEKELNDALDAAESVLSGTGGSEGTPLYEDALKLGDVTAPSDADQERKPH